MTNIVWDVRDGWHDGPAARLSVDGGRIRAEVIARAAFVDLGARSLEACDRCGAIARVLVVLPDTERLPLGGRLTFCAHHARAYGGGLGARAAGGVYR